MRPNRIERQKELECAISLKQKEMEDLHERKAALEKELGINSGAFGGGDISAAFPVLEYCGRRPRKDIRTLPIENVTGVMSQLDIAAKVFGHHNAALQQQVRELNRMIAAEGKRCRATKARTTSLADATGFQVSAPSQSNGHKLITNNEPGEEEISVTVRELEAQKTIIDKEIRAGELLCKKKEQTIVSLSNNLKERQAILDEIDSLNNDIRVTDRDAKCEKEELQKLIVDHDDVDKRLNAVMEVKTSASRLLIQGNTTEIESEMKEIVNGARRGQGRVIKAQDYRIKQLESRLESIQKALDNNHLTREVEAILSQSWAAKDALLVVGDEEDMYDLATIIPAQEKCHPAIYNLFLTEKERLARRISLLNIIAKEKEEVVDALACKVEALARECQGAIEDLDQVASGAAYKEEEQRIKAMESIQEQRVLYSDLLFERQQLKSRASRTPQRMIKS